MQKQSLKKCIDVGPNLVRSNLVRLMDLFCGHCSVFASNHHGVVEAAVAVTVGAYEYPCWQPDYFKFN